MIFLKFQQDAIDSIATADGQSVQVQPVPLAMLHILQSRRGEDRRRRETEVDNEERRRETEKSDGGAR